ncbi:hypothetical protein [Fournierella sp.]|uniref:hypothetical protein n=1 Tax=Allofournierella sp. TaxID=1940256 RepID=UPI0025B9C49C|nr:hypothetical protein [Fournierella sp.]
MGLGIFFIERWWAVPNEENLKAGKATQFKSGEEAARNGKKGGEASGVARRRKKALRDSLQLILDLDITDKRKRTKLKRMGVSEADMDNQMVVALAVFQEAAKGNMRAVSRIVDIVGTGQDGQTEDLDDGLMDALKAAAQSAWGDGEEGDQPDG